VVWHSEELQCKNLCRRIRLSPFQVHFSPRADDEFSDGILGNQKFKRLYYLNVSESGIESR
jgi:hypothetical protein